MKTADIREKNSEELMELLIELRKSNLAYICRVVMVKKLAPVILEKLGKI